MIVCVFVPKDLAKRWTDTVLLYSKAVQERFKTIFREGTSTNQKEIIPQRNFSSHPKNVEGRQSPPSLMCIKRPIGGPLLPPPYPYRNPTFTFNGETYLKYRNHGWNNTGGYIRGHPGISAVTKLNINHQSGYTSNRMTICLTVYVIV